MEVEGSGGGSSESEITGIGKTVSSPGSSTCSEHESSTAASVRDVSVQEGTAGLPDPVGDVARKPADKVGRDSDSAGAPVASTSFKRSGGGSSSRRTVQKRVVTVPIADIGEGSRPRSGGAGDGGAPPPSDSWTWRKYGQKPIKGSPYPRGYYRCSSSKGCPARKQVERSRADPTMLIVTYAADHNHPCPLPRNHHASRQPPSTQAALGGSESPRGKPPSEYENAAAEDGDVEVEDKIPEATTAAVTVTPTTTTTEATTTSSQSEDTETFSADQSLSNDSTTLIPPMDVEDLGNAWGFPSATGISLCSNAATMLPFSYKELLADLAGSCGRTGNDDDGDDDENSLFAGLGELPEFSLVFQRTSMLPEQAADFAR